jgi:DNA mismatch endonuclease (patch repair protein)
MADVHSIATRSYNMSRIKGKDTKPELLVRRFLFSHGFRYRLHDKKLPGKPDIVLPKLKSVIFVHGCFWHGHDNCKYFVVPKTRTDWWLQKINRNKQLDVENFNKLKEVGWNVLTIFECQLRSKNVDETLKETVNKLTSIQVKL